MSLALLVAKVTLALAGALGLQRAAHRASAAVRGVILTAVFLLIALLPVATWFGPSLSLSLTSVRTLRSAESVAPDVDPSVSQKVLIPMPEIIPVSSSPSVVSVAQMSLLTWLTMLWFAGSVVALVPLIRALSHARRLRRAAMPWQPHSRVARLLQSHTGGPTATILRSDLLRIPVACGLWNPAVIFPTNAAEWDDESLSCAFLHESEHVRRRDWALLVWTRAVCALYWWHPLVWIAWRRLRLEVERACDDAVVCQAERCRYASQLVKLARNLSRRTDPLIAMASRSDLDVRIASVLDTTRSRSPLTAGMGWRAVLIASAMAVVVAPLRVVAVTPPMAQTVPGVPVGVPTGSLAGVVYDPTGAPLGGLLLFVEGDFCAGRPERPRCLLGQMITRTDRRGMFHLDGVPVGNYAIIAPIDFFPGTSASVEQGETTQVEVTMRVEPVVGEFTICADCPTLIVPESLAREFAADDKDALDHPVSAPRPAGGWESYLPGTGVYPADLREAGLEGTVVIEGHIGVDGVPTSFKVASSSSAQLATAATNALSSEIWEPGRVRGTAMEVPFRFLIRYALASK